MDAFPFGGSLMKGFPWILLCALMSGAAQAIPWSKIRTPAPGPAAAIGGASNGCIQGAQPLPAQGTGFVSIRRHRNRYGDEKADRLLIDPRRVRIRLAAPAPDAERAAFAEKVERRTGFTVAYEEA